MHAPGLGQVADDERSTARGGAILMTFADREGGRQPRVVVGQEAGSHPGRGLRSYAARVR